tara:strand:- start:39360 stop:40781 length:1422 start_codon:yes stop_codon:yes gene_type:complete
VISATHSNGRGAKPQPNFWQALSPVIVLIGSLALNVQLYGGEPHIPLIIGTAAASVVGVFIGYRWTDLEEGMVSGIAIALKAILILLIVGLLIATWIAGGVVPLLIYYGLKILSPSIFLVATCIICSIVSLATGSSWTTAGTVGVALMAVGQGLGIPLPMVAGAIVSGAYFGDKMSPLSDTTNLSPAVSGSEIFEHIRHMMYTTIPGFCIALILYAGLGLYNAPATSSSSNLSSLLTTLETHYNLSPILLTAPFLILILVIYKVPAIPALLAGSVLGGVLACVFQGQGIGDILGSAKNGFVSQTGNEQVDNLLTRGGIQGMLNTIALVLCAMSFGGIMEKTGMLRTLASSILETAKSAGSLVFATVLSCLGMNAIAPDQYLALIVPGRMYRGAFRNANLHPKNLSRCLEDAGTLTSPLIAYNTCGAYMSKVLGVSAGEYFLFAFLNLLTPLISVLYGFTGWTIKPLGKKEIKD